MEQIKSNKSGSITSNNEIFDRIHYHLFSGFDQNIRANRTHCKILSLVCAGYLLEFYNKTFIINSNDHAVCYAGSDTWDLTLGIVFRDYKYPDLKLPRPEMLPSFEYFFDTEKFDIYYSQEGLLNSAKSIKYEVIRSFDGTKNPT